jgi:hypothetical protein
MSDDFGTVNVSRADRAREIDEMRQQFRRHRESLQQLAADAPTERFASEYNRLIAEIDAAMAKVDELEPGMRPLVPPPRTIDSIADYEAKPGSSGSRVILIAVVALIALAAIGWLIWKASSDRNKPTAIVEQPATTTTAAPSTTTEPPPEIVNVLTATPASTDYGTIHKGTRATRQFTIRNESSQPVTMQVARSACRCLYYEYHAVIAPKGKETVTVTIDGAKAKAGQLRETIKVTAKADPSVATSFNVTANIQ